MLILSRPRSISAWRFLSYKVLPWVPFYYEWQQLPHTHTHTHTHPHTHTPPPTHTQTNNLIAIILNKHAELEMQGMFALKLHIYAQNARIWYPVRMPRPEATLNCISRPNPLKSYLVQPSPKQSGETQGSGIKNLKVPHFWSSLSYWLRRSNAWPW